MPNERLFQVISIPILYSSGSDFEFRPRYWQPECIKNHRVKFQDVSLIRHEGFLPNHRVSATLTRVCVGFLSPPDNLGYATPVGHVRMFENSFQFIFNPPTNHVALHNLGYWHGCEHKWTDKYTKGSFNVRFRASLVQLQLITNKMLIFWFIYFNQLYMFRAMFSPIIRSISP